MVLTRHRFTVPWSMHKAEDKKKYNLLIYSNQWWCVKIRIYWQHLEKHFSILYVLFHWKFIFHKPRDILPQYANFCGINRFWCYPLTKPLGKHFYKFHHLRTYYNNFHIFESNRNPYGRNKKIWGKCVNFAVFQQILIGSHSKNW